MLFVITVVVAICPLIFVVKTFPDTDCENELIIFTTFEITPLIIVWNVFPVDEATLLLMIDTVDVTPLIVETRVFVAEERRLAIYPQGFPVPTIFPFTSEVRHCDEVPVSELNLRLFPINVPLAILKFKLESKAKS